MSVPTTLSVIITSKGKPEELDGAIANMLNQDHQPDEIIVLDNDPQGCGRRAEHIGDRTVRYLCPGSDLGMVAGRNRAAREAKGDVLLFMADYVRFDKYNVTGIILNAMRPREIGCLTFQVRNASSHELITEEYPGTKSSRSTEPREVSMVGASAFAMRRSVFEEVGGFDERLFDGEEGIELAFRTAKAGWQIRYVPDILLNYRVTMRDVDASPAYRYLRNRLYLALKHLPFPFVITYGLAWGFFSLYLGITRKETDEFIHAVKAFKDEGLWQAATEFRKTAPPSWSFVSFLNKHEGRVLY